MTLRPLFFLALALSCLFALAPSVRAEGLVMKNSFDYTADDGVMSPEEMQMEAQDFYTLCSNHAYQSIYFDCACLAGAFLQQREKHGPVIMQDEIFATITNSAETDASCANTERLAGRTFDTCMGFMGGFARTELNGEQNVEICTCAANKMARDFSLAPRLSSSYIEALRYRAMISCRDPKFREDYKAQSAAAAATPNAATPAPADPRSAN